MSEFYDQQKLDNLNVEVAKLNNAISTERWSDASSYCGMISLMCLDIQGRLPKQVADTGQGDIIF